MLPQPHGLLPGGDDDVADLAAQPGMTAVQLAVQDEAGADAGADGDDEGVAVAGGRAVAGFGPGGRVGVVVDDGGQPGLLGEQVPQRQVAVGIVRCPPDVTAWRSDHAGCPGADRLHGRVMIAQGAGDLPQDIQRPRPVTGGRGGDLEPVQDSPVLCYHCPGDLGPADIQADGGPDRDGRPRRPRGHLSSPRADGR